MLLRLRSTAQRTVIYREQWATLAAVFLTGTACIAFASGFFWLMRENRAAMPFLVLFCGAFGLAGILTFVRLPGRAREMARNDGAPHLQFDAKGVCLTPFVGSKTLVISWKDVRAIRLTETLKTIDRYETGYSWRIVLIMLSADQQEPRGFFERVKAGILRSGEGHRYVVGRYPRGMGKEVGAAIRRHAPAEVDVCICKSVVFDRKSQRDSAEKC